MTYKAIQTLILTAAVLVLPATSFAKVRTSYDQDVNLAAYQTYTWAENLNPGATAAFEQIQAGIDFELAALGFELVEEGGDLVVSVEMDAIGETRTHVTEIYPYHRYRARRWYRWGAGHQLARIELYEVTAGNLRVELTDLQANQTVWTGEAEGTVRKSQEKNARKATKALDKMFRDFPFQPAQSE